MKRKLDLNPTGDLKQAPKQARVAYIVMLALGLAMFTATIMDGISSWWAPIVGAFAGYIFADAGLLIVRGRKLGRTLSLILAVALNIWSVFLLSYHGNVVHEIWAALVAALTLGLALMVFSAPMRSVFATDNKKSANFSSLSAQKRAAAARQKTASSKGPETGSWAEIQAALNEGTKDE